MKPDRESFLSQVKSRFGIVRGVEGSRSLHELGDGVARFYIRSSKRHSAGYYWYGLRKSDLATLGGSNSFIVLLCEGMDQPVVIPYSDYEEVFERTTPSPDGQYKIHLYPTQEGMDLYLPRHGRVSVSEGLGWSLLERALSRTKRVPQVDLDHTSVQSMLGRIGVANGYTIWIPKNNRGDIDWIAADRSTCLDALPESNSTVRDVLEEIDVLWLERGSGALRSLFEVEHSTSIYSGLLRFNDVHLAIAGAKPNYRIVADGLKKGRFMAQVNRPTFRLSRLNEICAFMNYNDVYEWYTRTNPAS